MRNLLKHFSTTESNKYLHYLKNYKAIIFDLDDTMYDYGECNENGYNEVYKYLNKKCKNTLLKSSFYTYLSSANKEVKDFLKKTASSHNRVLYFKKLSEYFFLDDVATSSLEMFNAYNKGFFKNIKPYKKVLEFIKSAKSYNVKIGICTDMVCQEQLKKIKKLKIEKYINYILTSEEVGVEKPNHKMYELILDKLNVKKSECLFIGDDLEKDVSGPKEFGIQSIHISEFLWGK